MKKSKTDKGFESFEKFLAAMKDIEELYRAGGKIYGKNFPILIENLYFIGVMKGEIKEDM